MATQPTVPYCRLSDLNCVQCLTNDHCTPPATCGTTGQNNGRCVGGMPEGGGIPEAGGGG
jgi:hypothetical protein